MTSIPKITFLALRQRSNAFIWPSGPPENLEATLKDADGNTIAPAPLTMLYNEALAEIAKWVPCEQVRLVNVHAFATTYFKGGMTVVPAPNGVVTRVYTIANARWNDRVFYVQKEWPEPEGWMRNLITGWRDPANAAVVPALPLGFKKAESTTDRDANGVVIGRARAGIWALHDQKIWVAPWLQSNEKLVTQWRGIKSEWTDDDLVTATQDYQKAVRLYVQYGFERDYGDTAKARMIHDTFTGRGTFDEALGDLIWQCREQTKVQKREPQSEDQRGPITAELEDDEEGVSA